MSISIYRRNTSNEKYYLYQDKQSFSVGSGNNFGYKKGCLECASGSRINPIELICEEGKEYGYIDTNIIETEFEVYQTNNTNGKLSKYTQDKNRPCRNGNSSFDMLYPNISYLLKKFPNVTYRATIDQNTVEKTFENYCFADYLGFKNIFMMPNGREKWSIENQNKLKNELEKIYTYIANCFLNNEYPINFSTINESFNWVLYHDINVLDPRVKIECSRSCDRCGMGTSFGSIGYDGNIYGCQEQNSKDEKNIFLIGNIYNGGIDKKLHSNLLSKYEEIKISKCENEKLCESCKLRNICINYACPSTSWDLFKEFHIDNEIHC